MTFFRKIYVYTRRKFRVNFKKIIVKKEKKLLKNKNFIIIADNCWGGAIYQWYNKPYNSPFVGLAIYGECYIKLLSNFDYYMGLKLVFQSHTKYPNQDRNLDYPIGLLEDIEIHFIHYKTTEEAENKWVRRTKRMLEETNKNNYYFKICDEWKADELILQKFHKLPFKNKISFALKGKKIINDPTHIEIYERNKINKTTVPNGVKLFKISFLYFDITHWLLTGKIKRTTFKS